MKGAGKDLVLGFDFGTSSVKAALFDRDGVIAARAAVPYPVLYPAPSCVEQRPADWWDGMRNVTALLFAQEGHRERIAALAVAAQMCGVVPVDEHGEALRDALIWLDTRSGAVARRMMRGPIRIKGYGAHALLYWMWLTGGAPNLSGRDPPSKMAWLRENEPELWPRVHKLLDVKDYIVSRCTGRFVTSFDCAHLTWLYDARPGRKRWSTDLCGRAGISTALLPEIARASEKAGALSAAAAGELGLESGLPVSVGMGDVFAAGLGAGPSGYGAAHLYIGTSAWLGAMLPKSRVDPFSGIGSISGADGRDHLLIAAQENGGSCLGWVLKLMGLEEGAFATLDGLAATAVPDAQTPLFLPWLSGERVPVDDETLRGGFAGLAIGHGRADMAYAVYEGVALNIRWAMGAFARLAGTGEKPLRIAGGGATGDVWCRIFADVLQRPIERVEEPAFTGARGSAMAAAVTAGWYPDLGGAGAMIRTGQRFEPDRSRAGFYDARFKRFDRLRRTLHR